MTSQAQSEVSSADLVDVQSVRRVSYQPSGALSRFSYSISVADVAYTRPTLWVGGGATKLTPEAESDRKDNIVKARKTLASATILLVTIAAGPPAAAGAVTERTCDGLERPPEDGFYCYTAVDASRDGDGKTTATTGYLDGVRRGAIDMAISRVYQPDGTPYLLRTFLVVDFIRDRISPRIQVKYTSGNVRDFRSHNGPNGIGHRRKSTADVKQFRIVLRESHKDRRGRLLHAGRWHNAPVW